MTRGLYFTIHLVLEDGLCGIVAVLGEVQTDHFDGINFLINLVNSLVDFAEASFAYLLDTFEF